MIFMIGQTAVQFTSLAKLKKFDPDIVELRCATAVRYAVPTNRRFRQGLSCFLALRYWAGGGELRRLIALGALLVGINPCELRAEQENLR